MKKVIVFSFLLITIVSFAQNDILNDTIVKPVITELGKPDGAKAEMKIGKEGGSLKSSDGKVELIFPAGALKENTNIIIQPVTNLAPNGSGKAYWFEPSGIQFKKPVQIIINYTDEEAEVCPPDLMGLAIQNKQGQWSFIDYDSWDSTARLLTGSITHFSGATNVNKLMLIPKYVRIKVNSNFPFKVVNISSYFKSGNENDNTFYHNPPIGSDIIKAIMWYVNDIVSGDFHNGHIVSEILMGRGIYKAPNSLPKINPVTLKAELYLPKKSKEGKTLNLVKTFTSKILIYDNAYEVKMTSDIDQPSERGTVTYRDTGSFVVSLNGKEAKIIEKINKNTNDEFHYELPGCKTKTLKSGSGYIHMIGTPDITVTPATATQPARVRIQFIKTPLILSLLEFTCTDRDGKVFIFNTAQGNAVLAIMPAFPWSIEFFAKEGEWEIFETGFNIKEGETLGNQKALIKYMIKKLDDE